MNQFRELIRGRKESFRQIIIDSPGGYLDHTILYDLAGIRIRTLQLNSFVGWKRANLDAILEAICNNNSKVDSAAVDMVVVVDEVDLYNCTALNAQILHKIRCLPILKIDLDKDLNLTSRNYGIVASALQHMRCLREVRIYLSYYSHLFHIKMELLTLIASNLMSMRTLHIRLSAQSKVVSCGVILFIFLPF